MQILIIQTAFLGDVVLTTPLIRALLNTNAGAIIHVLARPEGCEALSGIDRVVLHSIDKKKQNALKSIRDTVARFKEIKFDQVFCVHRSLRSLLIGRNVKAEKRYAFSSPWSKFLGFETVPYPDYSEKIHYRDKVLTLLSAAGMERPQNLQVFLNAQDIDFQIGKTKNDYLVISPFSVWGTKMWFADRFAAAGVQVARAHGLKVVVTGSKQPGEVSAAAEIVEKIRSEGIEAHSVAGQTSIEELKALIKSARLVLSNDSAPVHIAAAFDVPVVAIFGPTVKKWGFFPLSTRSKVVERKELGCRPCGLHGPVQCPKKHFKCMSEISVEHVTAAASEIL